jgi:hypothetical protein
LVRTDIHELLEHLVIASRREGTGDDEDSDGSDGDGDADYVRKDQAFRGFEDDRAARVVFMDCKGKSRGTRKREQQKAKMPDMPSSFDTV